MPLQGKPLQGKPVKEFIDLVADDEMGDRDEVQVSQELSAWDVSCIL